MSCLARWYTANSVTSSSWGAYLAVVVYCVEEADRPDPSAT